MPQMAPMWWTTLLILFISSMLILSLLNSYSHIPTLFMNQDKTHMKILTWKW
uniref:ATP synthase F0 subunit 8 n=1 Tax=Gryllotalpa henana TaxID=3023679 RepID=UPI0023AB097E|nr:ATP synthase F0 subunit 8 [Gryllotalpa henana]WCD24129.1 ATP synthase F0 subunit 8 [Gryllotalpa henana]